MGEAISLAIFAAGLAATILGVAWQRGRARRPIRQLREVTGRALLTVAYRIDPWHEPRGGFSFTFEGVDGIRVRRDGRGCPLWYLSEDDYHRAWAESDRARDGADGV